MTAPTVHLDAARILGVKPTEIASVETVDDGVQLVAMATGRNVVYRIDGDLVMYQHKPDPNRTYDLPVYEPPVEAALIEDSDDEPLGGPASDKIADIVAWVRGGPDDEDPVEGWDDRARQALGAELAKGDKARSSLVDQLEAVLIEDPDDEP